MSAPALRVRLEAGYGKQVVLREICFELSAGERMGLLGSSGAGKSTLVLALLGLLPHKGGWARGEVLLGEHNVLSLSAPEMRRLRGRALALVPQSSVAALNPALAIGKHFEHAWRAHRAMDARLFEHRLQELFSRVGLPCTRALLRRKPGEISVGQAQRCTLALALLHRPQVVIADEPTSALDPVTQQDVTGLLREVCENDGTALIFVSHDLLSVVALCDRVAMLESGSIAEQIATKDLQNARSQALRQLLGTLPCPVRVLTEHLRARGKACRDQEQNEALPTPWS